jgi:acyl-CoA synthetase (AMP-forming)/AMP-acid ligase II
VAPAPATRSGARYPGVIPALGETVSKKPGLVDVIVAPGTEGEATDRSSEIVVAITFADLAAGDDREPECLVDDRHPLSYLYTSGTTSFPKGVVGNHTAIYLESLSMAVEARFNETDRFVAMMPMFHTAQLNCHCTAAVMVGATLFIERGFDAARLLALIEAERITQIFGLPMMYRQLLDHPDIDRRDLSSLRRALYAMATMPEAQLRRCIERFGCDFYLLFGQTEMSPTVTLFRPEHQLSHAGAVGTPVVNVQAAIMNEKGALLPQGEEGEIVYPGPHTITGYLDNPQATSAAFAHGWFHSGDIGHFDADGILWFSDRRKDVIKTGGENVASIEVEKALYAADPNVAEAVVVGAAARALDRGHHRGRRPRPGRPGRRERAARPGPRAAGPVQGAQGGHHRRRAAADLHRQDPEERAPRPLRPLLRPAGWGLRT